MQGLVSWCCKAWELGSKVAQASLFWTQGGLGEKCKQCLTKKKTPHPLTQTAKGHAHILWHNSGRTYLIHTADASWYRKLLVKGIASLSNRLYLDILASFKWIFQRRRLTTDYGAYRVLVKPESHDAKNMKDSCCVLLQAIRCCRLPLEKHHLQKGG